MMVFNQSRPINLIIIFNLLAFGLLYMRNQDQSILFSGLLIISIILLAYLVLRFRDWGDVYLFLIVSMLTSIGIVMIFRLDQQLGIKQIIWFVGGLILFSISYIVFGYIKTWHRYIYLYIAGSFLLFILTLVFGETIGGATNWVKIFGFTVQPSEYIKLIFVFFLASYYNNPELFKLKQPINFRGKSVRVKSNVILSLIVYTYLGFFVLQREWGGAVLFFLIHITLLFVFDPNKKILLVNTFFAVLGGFGGILFVDHIKVRIDSWVDPWADISGRGYQITQSLFAIGSGGFFGRGLGLGSPEYIPKVETDFIFSSICEELGIFGGVGVILLYFILVYRGFKISLSVENTFYKVLALGITVMFGFQTFIIIGGVIKLIPLTGITLPFISYGGSSLTTSFIALGILQYISKFANGDSLGGLDENE